MIALFSIVTLLSVLIFPKLRPDNDWGRCFFFFVVGSVLGTCLLLDIAFLVSVPIVEGIENR